MNEKPEFQQRVHPQSLGTRALQGAVIAFVLIATFLFFVGEPDPAWAKFWFIRPLVIVPLAGAVGGAFYFYMDNLRYQGSWKTALANAASLVVYLLGLWIGTVLGLAGTMWD